MVNNRKRNVLLTAQRLFTEKGYAATSVQDIIDESKISKGTFYNYFSSKNECIIAIIENAEEETALKRREMLVQQEIKNKDILIKQLSVKMEFYRERNLIPIFVAIFHSQDSDLREVIKRNHYEEVKWLATRLVDVFGEETKKISVDCAVLMLGMIQQVQHPWTVKSRQISVYELVTYVLKRVESIIYDMVKSQDLLIDSYTFNHYYDDVQVTKGEVILQLNAFYKTHKIDLKVKEQQLIEFLLEELNSTNPRKFLLETVISSFSNSFDQNTLDQQAKEISSNLWKIIDSIG
ncbi:TetR/AcrR family transcriptional regulator [Psychrobacillus sp. FSL H8-0483]|uniref:TetR/AcrR family transcriptional regulator n=1 Tax=Psychrobacillus sp. FSL H8-0483 TaxID=2921389 RepID=UPI003159BFC3